MQSQKKLISNLPIEVTLTFCFPEWVAFLSELMILLEDDLPGPSYRASEYEKLLV